MFGLGVSDGFVAFAILQQPGRSRSEQGCRKPQREASIGLWEQDKNSETAELARRGVCPAEGG